MIFAQEVLYEVVKTNPEAAYSSSPYLQKVGRAFDSFTDSLNSETKEACWGKNSKEIYLSGPYSENKSF